MALAKFLEPSNQNLNFKTKVVYIKAFDAKRRGRSVHIRFLSKVISQKKTQDADAKK